MRKTHRRFRDSGTAITYTLLFVVLATIAVCICFALSGCVGPGSPPQRAYHAQSRYNAMVRQLILLRRAGRISDEHWAGIVVWIDEGGVALERYAAALESGAHDAEAWAQAYDAVATRLLDAYLAAQAGGGGQKEHSDAGDAGGGNGG